MIILNDNQARSYVIDYLPPGLYYFAMRAVDMTGAESAYSNVISMTLTD